MSRRVPVVALTGHLGAGKTTLLNHLLRQPGARVGVVVNDFGAINVDAALVSGQVDEPASIAGGCLCCLEDAGGLDDALAALAQPRRALDVIVVEASGIAEPGALASMIAGSTAPNVRPGGVVDVVDAVEYFDTVDGGGLAPARFAIATLVVLNKADLVPEQTLARIEARVRERNPHAHVVRTSLGRIDPALVYDAASAEEPEDEPAPRRPPARRAPGRLGSHARRVRRGHRERAGRPGRAEGAARGPAARRLPDQGHPRGPPRQPRARAGGPRRRPAGVRRSVSGARAEHPGRDRPRARPGGRAARPGGRGPARTELEHVIVSP
ncbi:GTP-binding protein [Nocardioides convexus]|uniref:CobW family GTP-binding protein n=1 Tax=Nocardioides convexus TaxID=2712224 RepID=UPI002418A034|nr:GTP-binding protein [Nocardioides convexus]